MSTDDTGVWAYAIFTDESAEKRVAGLAGVAGEAVRVIRAEGLAAAVGTVGLDQFGEVALRRNLEDLDWLGVKARAHDAVVSALARSGPVIPVRMATVYLTDERVRRLLADGQTVFRAALERVDGRVELGVKAYADSGTLAPADDPVSEAGGRGSGAAYLLRRKRQLHSQERAHGIAAAAAEQIHQVLLGNATDGKRKPVADSSLSGRAGWTVLNGTYLVDVDRIDEFRNTVSALDRQTDGIELVITGPWPPYSFTADVVSAEMAEVLPAHNTREIALVDLLDRVLAGGVVISGDITLSIADVDMVVISLRTLISSVGTLLGPAPEAAE